MNHTTAPPPISHTAVPKSPSRSRSRRIAAIGSVAALTMLAAVGQSHGVDAAGTYGIEPAFDECVEPVGQPGDTVVVNVTPVRAEDFGYGALRSVEEPSVYIRDNPTSLVNYGPGTADPNVGLAKIGTRVNEHQICFDNGAPPDQRNNRTDVILDQLAIFPAAAGVTGASQQGSVRLLDTRSGPPVAPGGTRCVTAQGEPGDTAAINVTPVRAGSIGNGAIRSSDAPFTYDSDDPTSIVNYAFGTTDPNTGFAVLGADNKICFDNSRLAGASVHVVLDQMSIIPAAAGLTTPSADGAVRLLDTRDGLPVGPGGSRCVAANGNAGDTAVINITPVRAERVGHGALRSADDPYTYGLQNPTSNVNYRIGSADPNVGFAVIGANNKICFDNPNITTNRVDVVLDQLIVIPAELGVVAPTPNGAKRLVDTRALDGVWCRNDQGAPIPCAVPQTIG